MKKFVVVGETGLTIKYEKWEDFKLRFKRVALHSKAVEFSHPVTGKRMSFNLPLADDMASFISK